MPKKGDEAEGLELPQKTVDVEAPTLVAAPVVKWADGLSHDTPAEDIGVVQKQNEVVVENESEDIPQQIDSTTTNPSHDED